MALSTPAAFKLKVTYFDGPWLAEPIRNTFILGGIDFEDERIQWADFAALKPSLPFGSLPILTVNDEQVYSQSDAILRYAGKLTGLYPADLLDAMKVDEVLGGLHDLFKACSTDKSAEAVKVAESDAIPRYAGTLDKMYSENTSGPFLFGDKITVADCQLSLILYVLPNHWNIDGKCLEEFTHLMLAKEALLEKVKEKKNSK